MEFGKVENVDAVDFSFPADHADTEMLLGKLKRKAKPQVHIGCAKWGRKDWVGKIYPPKTKEADFLKFYGTYFNSIELNAMFYRVFPRSTTEKWASVVPKDFRFAPKMTQSVTHFKRLKDAEADTDAFLESVMGFGDKLGHTFIQFSDNFGPKNLDTLRSYLEYLPEDLKVCVEFRHHEWFADTVLVDETFAMLREMKVGTVITDTSGRRDVLHQRLTTPVAFIRYVGNNLHDTDFRRIDDWVARMAEWIDSGIETIYFFIHNHEELNSPELCKYTIKKLNAAAGLNIAEPKLLNDGLALF